MSVGVRGSCGRERGLRSNALAPASTSSWLAAASVRRLKATVVPRGTQNALTEVDAMNRSARVPATQ
jgi:hypothetical protein